MNQEADEYLVKHGFSRKTVQILRPSIIELLVPLLADVERLREELEGELRANRVTLQAKVERLQPIVDVAMLWRMDDIYRAYETEHDEIDREEHLLQLRIILDEYRRTCEAAKAEG